MIELIAKANKFIAGHMFYVTIGALAAGFFFPLPNGIPYGKPITIILFAILTLFASVSLSIDDFFKVLKNPRIPLWLLFLVHIGTPVVAYIMGLICYPDDELMRLGLIIGSILPMGVTTIVWTNILGGNIAISVVAISLDTLLAPALTPIFMKFAAGQTVQINYLKMMFELALMVAVPSVLGMILNKKYAARPVLLGQIAAVGGFVSKFCMFTVIYLNAANVMPFINWSLDIVGLMLLMLLLVCSAFFLGYLGTLPFKNLDRGLFISIIYNVGMRNINFGMVLAIGYFPPAVAIPVTLMLIFQQPIAAILAYFIGRKQFR